MNKTLQKKINEDTKLFWKYVRSKSKTKITINELEDENGNPTSDSQEKARLLNRYFISVFTNEDTSNIPNFEHKYHGEPLNNIVIDEETVKKSD